MLGLINGLKRLIWPDNQQAQGQGSNSLPQETTPVPPVPKPANRSAPCETVGSIIYLTNEYVRIGVDAARGGGICYVANGKEPQKNLLNAYDLGRMIQQSYYGREDNSNWNGNPWRWNPVQCGSWQNQPAKVLKCCSENNNCIVTCVNPRNWAGQQLCEDMSMSSRIALEGDKAHIVFSFKYSGSQDNPPRIQELPAVFVNRTLGKLVFYDGPNPWKGEAVQVKTPGYPNENFRITENWAAWIDPTTNEGVGIFTPMAGSMTAYRVGPDGSTAHSDCSYFAPTMRFALKPGMDFTYHTFLTCGTAEQIRKIFCGLRGWALNNNPALLQSPVPDAKLAI